MRNCCSLLYRGGGGSRHCCSDDSTLTVCLPQSRAHNQWRQNSALLDCCMKVSLMRLQSFASSMEKEHALSKAIVGSKVLHCEYTGKARRTYAVAGNSTRVSPVAVFRGRQSTRSSPSTAPTTMTPPRTKVARQTNITNQNHMPQIEVGMRGEFNFETKWYRVEIIESSSSSCSSSATMTTSQSEVEEVFVVNYLNCRGNKGKDHTEDVSAVWLRGLVPVSKRCSSRKTSLPPRVYVGMLSKCRTEESGPEHILAPYEPGYVTKVLPDDKVHFKFFDSNYATTTINVNDLLFLSAPSIAGSAVTECERTNDQARTIIKSRNDCDSEDDDADMESDDTTAGACFPSIEIGVTKRPAKRVVSKKSLRPSPPEDATTEVHIPEKKRSRQSRKNNAPIELDGNPICSICHEDFSTDQSSFHDVRESQLPVMSMQCRHRVCCECLTRWQALEISKYRVVKKDRPKPKWMACPECKRSTAFNAIDVKVDTLLCGCLNKISRQDVTIGKQEAEITRLKAEIESLKKASAGSGQEKTFVEI